MKFVNLFGETRKFDHQRFFKVWADQTKSIVVNAPSKACAIHVFTSEVLSKVRLKHKIKIKLATTNCLEVSPDVIWEIEKIYKFKMEDV